MKTNSTLFICNNSAKYWAPSEPIWFPRTLSEVKVFVKDLSNDKYLFKRERRITVLYCNELAKCLAPVGPILFARRSSVVNICVLKYNNQILKIKLINNYVIYL